MMKVIGFHNPDEQYGFLSNWYLSKFSIAGIDYSSMEQYMMHQKALYFKDIGVASLILATYDVAEIKHLGRQVRNYNDSAWNGVRQIIVYEGLLAKFGQNTKLKRMLIETGDSILAECAVKDKIWGIGLSLTDNNRLNPYTWKGQNLLGYALMLVRDKLANL